MNANTGKIAGIAVVLMMVACSCAVLVSNDGSDAAAVTTPAKYTDAKMWVLGNADGDMDIDVDDVTMIHANIGKTSKQAPMCDANNDGTITDADETFVNNLINGSADGAYYYNVDGDICYFKKYSKINMVALHRCVVRSATILQNSTDDVKLVGMDSGPYAEAEFGVSRGVYKKSPIEDVGVLKQLSSENCGTLESRYMDESDECLVILLGTVSYYLPDLETWSKAPGKHYQVVRLSTWEGAPMEGILTTGYLFSGIGNDNPTNTCWGNALAYGAYAQKYLDAITAESSKVAVEDRLKALCVYTKGDHYDSADRTRGITSGDMENTDFAGANNIAYRFGTAAAVEFTMENFATYTQDVDVLISMTFNCYNYPDVKVADELKGEINQYDHFNGYIKQGAKFYGMTWALNGAPYIVQMLYYAHIFLPDSTSLNAYTMQGVYNEYLALMGWSDRTDISLNIDSVCSPVDAPMVFDKSANGNDSLNINIAYVAIAIVAIIAVVGVAVFVVKKR